METKIQGNVLVRKYKVIEAECQTCAVTIGPAPETQIGEAVYYDHEGHDVETVSEETKVESVHCTDCSAEATHFEERATGIGRVSKVPYCDTCGRQS